MKRHPFSRKFFLTLNALLFAVSFTGLAQDVPKPQLSRVSVTQVKPEMWEQFLAFYKNETLPALKKAGIKQSLVMQSSGPVGVEGYSKLSGRTTGVVMHTTVSAYTPIPELSITPAPARTASK